MELNLHFGPPPLLRALVGRMAPGCPSELLVVVFRGPGAGGARTEPGTEAGMEGGGGCS